MRILVGFLGVTMVLVTIVAGGVAGYAAYMINQDPLGFAATLSQKLPGQSDHHVAIATTSHSIEWGAGHATFEGVTIKKDGKPSMIIDKMTISSVAATPTGLTADIELTNIKLVDPNQKITGTVNKGALGGLKISKEEDVSINDVTLSHIALTMPGDIIGPEGMTVGVIHMKHMEQGLIKRIDFSQLAYNGQIAIENGQINNLSIKSIGTDQTPDFSEIIGHGFALFDDGVVLAKGEKFRYAKTDHTGGRQIDIVAGQLFTDAMPLKYYETGEEIIADAIVEIGDLNADYAPNWYNVGLVLSLRDHLRLKGQTQIYLPDLPTGGLSDIALKRGLVSIEDTGLVEKLVPLITPSPDKYRRPGGGLDLDRATPIAAQAAQQNIALWGILKNIPSYQKLAILVENFIRLKKPVTVKWDLGDSPYNPQPQAAIPQIIRDMGLAFSN